MAKDIATMPVNKNRAIERGAVNAFRALMERHDFVVQDTDGGNDHGEDVYVSFTERGERTGDTIAVQIKGGASYSAASGFRVPIRGHLDYWLKSNAPVYCVIQDSESTELFWANASAQIRRAAKAKGSIRAIVINRADVLCDDTVATFALKARLYISETGDFHKFLERLSGVSFDPSDYLAYFENIHGEQMIYRQEQGKPAATLLHSDLDWDPICITADDMAFTKPARKFQRLATKVEAGRPTQLSSTLRDVIINRSEYMWIEACFEGSQWIRERDGDQRTHEVHRIAPILYSPLQELKVAKYPWRQDPQVNNLMEQYIELGYALWPDQSFGQQSRIVQPDSRDAAWAGLKSVVQQLKSLKVPSYYLMENRGQLSRSEARELLDGVSGRFAR